MNGLARYIPHAAGFFVALVVCSAADAVAWPAVMVAAGWAAGLAVFAAGRNLARD